MGSVSHRSIKGLTLGLAASAALLFSAGLEARARGVRQEPRQPPSQEAPPPPARPRDVAGLLRRLNLTPEQVEQLRVLREQHQLEARPLLRRLNQARRALDEAVFADVLDEELIRERAREASEAQAALFRLHTLAEVRVRRVLTAEQLQRFRDLRREAQARQRLRRQRERMDRQQQGDAFDERPERRRRQAPNAADPGAPRPALSRPGRRRP